MKVVKTHPIHYRILLGKKQMPLLPIIPSEELKHPILGLFGILPHSLEHLMCGQDYYKLIADGCDTSGYEFICIYIDDLQEALKHCLIPKQLMVFLICADDEPTLNAINAELQKYHQPEYVYLASEEAKAKLALPNVLTSVNELLDFIACYAQNNEVTKLEKAKAVSQTLRDSVTKDYQFAPCTVNLMTAKSMLGEFRLESSSTREERIEKLANASIHASSNIQSFERQDNLSAQICSFRQLEAETLDHKPDPNEFIDQFVAPLVLSYPFIGVDFRKTMIEQTVKLGGDKNVAKTLKEVLSHEQTTNYCGEYVKQGNGNTAGLFITGTKYFHKDRHQFIDFAASLHCSLRFSPYLRLPLSGKSFNAELSSVGPAQGPRLISPSNARKVVSQIKKIGKKMSEKLAFSTLKMLEYQPSQIVAMTDLPIEWMDIEGVPLGFSHDVCRVPLTPISGLLTHYVINYFTPYTIPTDIIKRTLVVYGCTTPNFKVWQDRVEKLKEDLGFNTIECKSLDDFKRAINHYKPEFLIIDTHGDVDMQQHQSYLWLGNEKLYPAEIAKRNISARMVFLSACMTAPTYNDINTVANAFLEVGAQTVTSSYLPLDITESSLLYLRILQLLPMAANKAIHHNWLSFISYVLRTSYILTPSLGKNTESKFWLDALKSGVINASSMLFTNRRHLYEGLQTGKLPDTGYQADYSQIIPHYLLYSTIGRADLIEFESTSNKQ